ncbi:hypothetical protein COY95_01865, partial [Candidatus Woesearchaeota archaeon CG_4_10_14_0_8_um_filter_47_5]
LERFKEFFELPGDVNDKKREERIKARIAALRNEKEKESRGNGKSRSLEEEQEANETAAVRCIGLTIETRPDWGYKEQGLEFLRLGVTRVELGVQTVYDEVLQKVNRGHDVEASIKSMAELRDLGFKVNIHMMLGLPRHDGKRLSRAEELSSLKKIFEDPAFRPDMLKIYPCLVMPGTGLEELYKKGVFAPIATEEAAEIIVEVKRFIPEYCRIMRIQRDIPTHATTAGVDRTNLRQYVAALAKREGVVCRCIRCREVGRRRIVKEPRLVVREYEASNGREFFMSMEACDRVLGFLRMRFPNRLLHPAITEESALIRELHVYGQAVAVGESDASGTQHRGLGKKLMDASESTARMHGKKKMVVISGVGAREYYRRQGYVREGPYMVKVLVSG